MESNTSRVMIMSAIPFLVVAILMAAPASGPLRVHPSNPRYFTDGTRNPGGSPKAIYLVGHQIFVDLQDNTFNKEWTKDMSHPDDPAARARLLDWNHYLEFVEKYQFNYLRGWILWSTGSGSNAPPNKITFPMPFSRVGPEKATDGNARFDLNRFDETFFRRLHDRARDLQARGVYLSVMLFELYGFLDGEDENGQRLWDGNLFDRANNVNGMDVDRNQNRMGEEFFSLDDPAIVKLQKAYIEKMVDTLNDLDNILWEICNEAPFDAIEWQNEMMRHLKSYEAKKPKQHLTLLSPGGWIPGGWKMMPEEKFVESSADCIATANGWIDRENPKVYQLSKPVMMDLDHVAPGSSDPALAWKGFTRGYHFSLYDHPFEQPQNEGPAWQTVRQNLKFIRILTHRVPDLAQVTPRPDLADTGFCLASEGKEYIVYAPNEEDFAVRGLRAGQTYGVEWIDSGRASVQTKDSIVPQSTIHRFQPPGKGAVLFLEILDRSLPSHPPDQAPK